MWPGLERRKQQYSVCLSHDVDSVQCVANRSLARNLRSVGADLLLRRDLGLAVDRVKSYMSTRAGNVDADLANTFDFIMDVSESNGLQSAFYFMSHGSLDETDAGYLPTDPWVRGLLRRIHTRGHEIGYHASYDSFDKPAMIEAEFRRLVKVCEEEGILREHWGGRHHYLRWQNPITWQAWDDADLGYDTTLSFQDHVGFRCGVCYEYPVFNLFTRQQLGLRERPLVVMEGTMFNRAYMGISDSRAIELVSLLAETCKQFDGTMSLLWHNTSLLSDRDRRLYKTIVDSITGPDLAL